MAKITSKKIEALRPRVALYALAPWINQQLDQGSWGPRDSIARKIVNSLSLEELRSLPPETRNRLRAQLGVGRVSNADRRAVDKLLSAEIIEVNYRNYLVLKGPSDFVDKTKEHLTNLTRIPIGRRLLHSIGRSGKRVTIIPASRITEAPPEDFRAAIPKGKVLKWRNRLGEERLIKGTGAGSNTTIKYNHQMMVSAAAEAWRQHPPEIGLAHELIHADDAAYGRLDPEEIDGIRNYERQAIGLSPYEQKEFTENKFRAQWPGRLPDRTTY